MSVHLFPPLFELKLRASETPEYMVPSELPYAVALEGALTDRECDKIQSEFMELEPYSVPHCNAVTREKIGHAYSLDLVYAFSKSVNEMYWKYDLNPQTAAWMQTYGAGNDYQLHMDGSPGQTRKLTAVVMLTDPGLYSGGELVLLAQPAEYIVPKTRGTIVFFPHWLLHRVDPVTRGMRQTINLGYWGPSFK